MTRPGEQDSQLNVRIPAEMKLWLREIAKSTTDCNMSDLAREAIKLLMAKYMTQFISPHKPYFTTTET